MAHASPEGDPGPIRSAFSDDPDMIEIVQEFVQSMPDRVSALEAAFASQDLASLQRLSHQLKGACGGYGFDEVGHAAGRVEASLMSLPADAGVSALQREVNELVSMCQRVCL